MVMDSVARSRLLRLAALPSRGSAMPPRSAIQIGLPQPRIGERQNAGRRVLLRCRRRSVRDRRRARCRAQRRGAGDRAARDRQQLGPGGGDQDSCASAKGVRNACTAGGDLV